MPAGVHQGLRAWGIDECSGIPCGSMKVNELIDDLSSSVPDVKQLNQGVSAQL